MLPEVEEDLLFLGYLTSKPSYLNLFFEKQAFKNKYLTIQFSFFSCSVNEIMVDKIDYKDCMPAQKLDVICHL